MSTQQRKHAMRWLEDLLEGDVDITQTFKDLDFNDDGFISKAELLRHVRLGLMDATTAESLLAVADTDVRSPWQSLSFRFFFYWWYDS